ncbi:hypothetical protein L596_022202 [Steinernema carpocapsae]|uniref:Uncharacterized protein n=1 Tax=Steinernema carpocapsae TaxID=34508 RepID=A0A4U5ML38_STECR|nr:hypothetical protein L596_022202 [Steinernema carpocapsae]
MVRDTKGRCCFGMCDLVHNMIFTGLLTIIFGILELLAFVYMDAPILLKIGLLVSGILNIPCGFFAAYGSWHRTSYLLRPFMAFSKAKCVVYVIGIVFTICSHINWETAVDNFQMWDSRKHPDNEEHKARMILLAFTVAFILLFVVAIKHYCLCKKTYRFFKAEEAAKQRPAVVEASSTNDRLAARMNNRQVAHSNYF